MANRAGALFFINHTLLTIHGAGVVVVAVRLFTHNICAFFCDAGWLVFFAAFSAATAAT
jgi:hypothetical protein